jgi:Alpha/beta hydrolase family
MKLEDAVANLLDKNLPEATVQEAQWSCGGTRVIQAGSGEEVLFVHGGLGDAFAWIPILPALARRFRVYAVDLPGHGLADGFDFRGSNPLEVMSAFLEDVIEGLRLQGPRAPALMSPEATNRRDTARAGHWSGTGRPLGVVCTSGLADRSASCARPPEHVVPYVVESWCSNTFVLR